MVLHGNFREYGKVGTLRRRLREKMNDRVLKDIKSVGVSTVESHVTGQN